MPFTPRSGLSHAQEVETPQETSQLNLQVVPPRPAPQLIKLHPLRSEHYSALYDVTKRLSADLDLEVVFVSRTTRLNEAALHVTGKEIDRFLSRLGDYFLDAEIWVDVA